MQGEEDASQQAFVLLAAYGATEDGKTKQGIVVMADRRQENPAGANWAPKYFDILAQALQAHDAQRVGAVQEYSFAEKKFYRGDFHRTGPDEGYQTILLLRRGYVLGFQFVAPSEKDIDRLITSLNTLKFVSTEVKSGAAVPKKIATVCHEHIRSAESGLSVAKEFRSHSTGETPAPSSRTLIRIWLGICEKNCWEVAPLPSAAPALNNSSTCHRPTAFIPPPKNSPEVSASCYLDGP